MSDPKDDARRGEEQQEHSAASRRPGALFQSSAGPERRPGGLLLGLILGGSALLLTFYLVRVYRNSRPQPVPEDAAATVVEPVDEGPALPLGAMVRVEGGTFLMGSMDGDPDERPVTEVKVAGFDIDLTEVPVTAYQGCLEAGKCTPPEAGPTCNWNKLGKDRHPINCVDWRQAVMFCAFAGKRLPTEQEWEYAARGADGRKYPWKDGPPGAQLCWNGAGNDLGKDNRQGTCAVGRYPAGASPFGALDMAGNVWEWTATSYCPSYEGKDCKEDRKVIRGGGWNNVKAEYVRAQDRSNEPVKAQRANVGFRCARAAK